jgi:membrane protein
VLGLMWWIYFESQITLLAVEIHIVRQLKLWPRSLTEPPLMPADKKVYTKYAVGEKRRPEQEINVDFPE